MVHAARALGLRVMIGCMVESQLGVAPAAQIASLADWVDLDGHLLLADEPFRGLQLEDGPRAAVARAGAGRGAGRVSEKLAIFAEGLFAAHNGKTAHGVIRYGTRDVVAVIDSTQAGRTAVGGRAVLPAPGADRRDAGRGDRAGRHGAADRRRAHGRQARPGLARAAARGDRRRACTWRPGCTPSSPRTPSCAGRPRAPGVGAARPARGAGGPDRAGGPVQPPRLGARWCTASARTP